MFSKRLAWIILVCLFIFDSTVSYIAITRMQGREANLAIAYLVERFPWLYFIYLPAQVLIVYLIYIGLTKLERVLIKSKLRREQTEKVILTAMVIYWLIGNSAMNLSFVLGKRLTIPNWYLLSIFGLLTGICYFLLLKNQYENKKN